jgi:DNA-binding NarL/FixJ family response regulator
MHVQAGLRLRLEIAPLVAVLDADHRVVHAAPGVACTQLVFLRERAKLIDRTRGGGADPEHSLAIWSSMLTGDHSFVDRFDTDGRRFIVIRANPADARDPRGLSPRERDVAVLLERRLSNKAIAIELGLAEGCVAGFVASIRRKLRVTSRAELARAIAAPDAGRVTELRIGRERLVVMSAPSAALRPLGVLTSAERDVAIAVAGGASNAAIARTRGTSESTIVNQLVSIYRKLGIHSRAELGAAVYG